MSLPQREGRRPNQGDRHSFTTPHIVEYQRFNPFLREVGNRAKSVRRAAKLRTRAHKFKKTAHAHTNLKNDKNQHCGFSARPHKPNPRILPGLMAIGGSHPPTIIEITRKFVTRCAVPTSGPTSAYRIPAGGCTRNQVRRAGRPGTR